MRRAAKIDANQTQVVIALRAAGATVQSLAAVGVGVPDLLVGFRGQTYLMEVKDGQKAPIEMKISKNYLVEQICIVGSSLPQPIGLVVLSIDAKTKDREYLKESLTKTLELINPLLEKHERVKKLVVTKEDWTIENGLLTPTMKIKRNPIESKYSAHYEVWYNHTEEVLFE